MPAATGIATGIATSFVTACNEHIIHYVVVTTFLDYHFYDLLHVTCYFISYDLLVTYDFTYLYLNSYYLFVTYFVLLIRLKLAILLMTGGYLFITGVRT